MNACLRRHLPVKVRLHEHVFFYRYVYTGICLHGQVYAVYATGWWQERDQLRIKVNSEDNKKPRGQHLRLGLFLKMKLVCFHWVSNSNFQIKTSLSFFSSRKRFSLFLIFQVLIALVHYIKNVNRLFRANFGHFTNHTQIEILFLKTLALYLNVIGIILKREPSLTISKPDKCNWCCN